ncbi:hypothetical protein [Duffyella gerundensis]|uniref:hypothetical protein n=1 Tax=Duffyella gerundensis TaxID=1619313 RepID=UPI0021F71F1F|nr:hypothetical protein [Duffyella gerundensis]
MINPLSGGSATDNASYSATEININLFEILEQDNGLSSVRHRAYDSFHRGTTASKLKNNLGNSS